MTNFILLLFAFIIFTSYVSWVWIKYGILPSISDSYYHSHNGFLFAMFTWGVGIPIMLVGSTPLMFFAGAFLCFVGSAPTFKEKVQGIVHVIGATGGILLGFLSLWIDFHLWPITAVMATFTVLATVFKLKHHTWWIEIAAFVLILLGLGIAKF